MLPCQSYTVIRAKQLFHCKQLFLVLLLFGKVTFLNFSFSEMVKTQKERNILELSNVLFGLSAKIVSVCMCVREGRTGCGGCSANCSGADSQCHACMLSSFFCTMMAEFSPGKSVFMLHNRGVPCGAHCTHRGGPKEVYSYEYVKHGVCSCIIYYCAISHMNNCTPTFAPPCLSQSNGEFLSWKQRTVQITQALIDKCQKLA